VCKKAENKRRETYPDAAPSLRFFTGDLVFGLDRDVLVLERQLRA